MPTPFSYVPSSPRANLPGVSAPTPAIKGPVPFKYVPGAAPSGRANLPVAASVNTVPPLGQGAAGEFAGNAVRTVGEGLIRTGGLIESGLDQTAGRVINAVQGKGFIPTTSGADAQRTADESAQNHDAGISGFLGDALGTVAPYLTPAGEVSAAERAATVVPKVAQVLGTTAKAFLPRATGFVAEHAPTAIRDAAIGTAQTGNPREGALIGVGTVIGKRLPAPAGRVISGVGEAIYKDAITPTVNEAEHILKYKADQPFPTRVINGVRGVETPGKPITRAETALKKGIFGTETMVGVQAKRIADSLYSKEIAPAVKASTEVVTKDDLFAPIVKRIENTIEPGRKIALQDAFNAIKADYGSVGNFSLEDAQALKRQLDEFTPEKIFKGKSVVSEYRTLNADMANAIRQKTYAALKDEGIKQKYLDYGNLAELQKVGVKAISESGSKGGFGNFVSSAWDKTTTPVKTVGGQILYRVGNTLEFLAKPGVKTLGEYLTSKGIRKP